MKILFLSLFTISVFSGLSGQNLVGLDENDIKVFMKENKQDFTLQNDNNDTFNYIKYTDNNDTETILFFLTEVSVCKEERIIFDQTLKKRKLEELESTYKKVKENVWTEKKGNIEYLIELNDENWYFTINIKQKE